MTGENYSQYVLVMGRCSHILMFLSNPEGHSDFDVEIIIGIAVTFLEDVI